MMRPGWIASVLGALAIAACGDHGTDPSSDGATVDEAVAADLQFLREEEKLARDVYETLYQRWALRPHANIGASEQTHMDRVAAMLADLGLPDPVADDTIGVFANDELGQLFADLVASGQQSEIASLRVGATIEDLDIRDIDAMAERATDASVLSVYDALRCGSRNHLRAFASQLAARGASYSPQYLGQAEYDAILAGAQESCG